MNDRIEKTIVLKASRRRVWRALSDAREFGSWFGVTLEGEFRPGATLAGQITQPGYTHLRMEITIERFEPEHLLSWRWHPGAAEPDPREPTTLVEFRLEDVGEHTRLTVVESGFERLPQERRGIAWRENDEGWTQQLKAIERHVAKTA